MNEGTLSEKVSFFNGPNNLSLVVLENDFSALHDIEGKRGFTAVEENVVRFQMDLLEEFGVARAQEVDIAGKKKIESPVDHDAEFPVEAGEL